MQVTPITPITITVTSCDRFDLLKQTLDSFFELNTYPIGDIFINNDSINDFPIELKNKYKHLNITWLFGTKRGLSASWDYLLSFVKTEYFFNLEDDWLFSGNPDFIEQSIIMLQYYDQVWVRSIDDHKHPLEKSPNVYVYKVLPFGDWCGFSFNPSVRKLSYWRAMFPNGISGKDEIELSRQLKGKYNAVSLVNSACRHIGWNRHSQNFIV